MTDTIIAAATVDHRLADFAERLRKVIAGEPEEVTDAEWRENAANCWDGEEWRYDRRAEALESLHAELGSLVDDMRAAHYATLPPEVRAADAAASAAARAKRDARWAKLRAVAA